MDFLSQYWIQIITIIIAVLGGIPGIVNLIKYQKSKAKFVANTKVFSYGGMGEGENSREFVLLFLHITNKGTDPINPIGFSLSYKKGRKWIKMQLTEIPDWLNQPSPDFDLEYSENLREKDLGKRKYTLKQGEFESGVLMFSSNEITQEDFEESKTKVFKLLCEDVTGELYKTKLISNKKNDANKGGFPLLDVRTN